MSRFAKLLAAELEGVEAKLIEVETDINTGLHNFTIVGLADKSLSEAKERVNAALKNSGKDTAKLDKRISVLLARRDAIRSAAQTIDNFRPRLQRIADMIAGRDGKAV